MYLSLGVLTLAASSITLSDARKPTPKSYDTYDYYVLEHNPIHGLSPHQCAQAVGAQLVEQVGELKNHYVVSIPKPTHDSSPHLPPRNLAAAGNHGPVTALRTLRKRAAEAHNGRAHSKRLSSSIRSLELQTPRRRLVKRGTLLDEVIKTLDIKDPLFPKQWHIINEEFPEHMMNVTGVWKEGITGKNVISAIVDDGLDYESEDIAPNFDAEGSYDYNDHVPLPKPVLWDDHHGTRCAGEIAAAKNNACGVGLAYDSKVAGIRILSGAISDIDEAAALNHGFQKTALYSCSWGPPDDGKSMDGPSILIQKAVLNGINNGRDGKGSIFVFASGNGAGSGDQCNFDGYTNSIYSVTISAIDYKGHHPYYSEPCAANMVVTYSSGAGKHIVSTDVGQNSCSTSHGGTSAAAPLAVGVFALALEIRPDLTWRDIQHLCVRSAVPINPEDPDWDTTATGRKYSYKYGYGRLDAYRFVEMARGWEVLKPQAWIFMAPVEVEGAEMVDGVMKGGEPITKGGVKSMMTVTAAQMVGNNFEKLEHVTVKVWITHSRRGDVEVSLTSPNGIKSVLASTRKFDEDTKGFPGWQFMTLKHWGEQPLGEWTLTVNDQGKAEQNGTFLGWSMNLWGESYDSHKAKKFELEDDDEGQHNLPPSATDKTKVHPKPTNNLPSDHGAAPGETTKAAFPVTTTDEDSIAENTGMPDAPDEGTFNHIYDLLSDSTWLVGAVGVVVLFGLGAGIFFWLRRWRLQKRNAYSALSDGGDMGMRPIDRDSSARAGLLGSRRSGNTRELYDAFGVLSDEEDQDDDGEEGALRGAGGGYDAHPGRGLGYHEGFLDDDGPPTAGTPTGPYRDEPELAPPGRESPGSGDGSWQDASEGVQRT